MTDWVAHPPPSMRDKLPKLNIERADTRMAAARLAIEYWAKNNRVAVDVYTVDLYEDFKDEGIRHEAEPIVKQVCTDIRNKYQATWPLECEVHRDHETSWTWEITQALPGGVTVAIVIQADNNRTIAYGACSLGERAEQISVVSLEPPYTDTFYRSIAAAIESAKEWVENGGKPRP